MLRELPKDQQAVNMLSQHVTNLLSQHPPYPRHAHLLPEGPVVRGGGEDLHGPVPQHRMQGHGRLDLREDALEGSRVIVSP